MKAKRNLFVSLVALMLLLCCSVLFVACHDEGGAGGNNSTTYRVTFKSDGRNYDIVLVEEGETVMFPTAPEKDGYTFDGWYSDEACTQEYTAFAVSQSIDVYAKFTANVYTITYEVDGGTNPNTASTFTVEDKVTLADAQKSGYTFDGWYLNAEYTEDKVTEIPKGTIGNITLYAKFTESVPSSPEVESIVCGVYDDNKLAWFRNESGSVVPNVVGLYIDVFYSDSTRTSVAVTDDMLDYVPNDDAFTVTVNYCDKTDDFDVKVFDSAEDFNISMGAVYYGYNYADWDDANNDILLADAKENGGLLRDYWLCLIQGDESSTVCYWYGVKLTEDMLRLYNETSEEYNSFKLSSLKTSESSTDYYNVKVVYGEITIEECHLYKVKASQLQTSAYYYSMGINGTNYYVSAGSKDFVMAQILAGQMQFYKCVVFDVWGNYDSSLQVYNGSFDYKYVTFGDLSDIDFGDYSKQLNLPAYLDGEKFYLNVELCYPYAYNLALQYIYDLYHPDGYDTEVLFLPDGKLVFNGGNYSYDYYWLEDFDDVIVCQDYLYCVDRENKTLRSYLISENAAAEKITTYSFDEPEDDTEYTYVLYRLNDKYYICYNGWSWIAELDEINKTTTWFDIVYDIGAYDTGNNCYPITVHVDEESKALYTYEDDYREFGGIYERWVYKDDGIRYYYVYDTEKETFVCSSYDFWEYVFDTETMVYVHDMFGSYYFFVAFLTEAESTAQ